MKVMILLSMQIHIYLCLRKSIHLVIFSLNTNLICFFYMKMVMFLLIKTRIHRNIHFNLLPTELWLNSNNRLRCENRTKQNKTKQNRREKKAIYSFGVQNMAFDPWAYVSVDLSTNKEFSIRKLNRKINEEKKRTSTWKEWKRTQIKLMPDDCPIV